MLIYVNNKLAAIKKGTSFEYVSENRLFSGSDGYTLSITFPLRDCPENLAIFGHINRADVAAQKVIFDCEIRDRGFYKFGSITITDVSETEVKTQFLEGRSEQNFDKTFDDIYINELELGAPPTNSPSQISPTNAWDPNYYGLKYVALPWVNNYSGNIQNLADYVINEDDNSGQYSWNTDGCTGLSWQPYLIHITKKICEALGYAYDLEKWEMNEEFKYLLVCNTIPFAWDFVDFARALPHWSVSDFFDKLELFLQGEFTINHRDKSVVFDFTENILNAMIPVNLDNIIDEHTIEIDVENDKCDYHEAKNIVYKDCDNEMWKFYSCDWFIKGWKKEAINYNTLQELIDENRSLRTWNGSNQRGSNRNKVLYAADVNAFFIVRAIKKKLVKEYDGWRPNEYIYKMELRPINMFGGRINDEDEDATKLELEFVPAWIDETEEKYGNCLFLDFSGYDESEFSDFSWSSDPETKKKEHDEILFQTSTVQSLAAGEESKKSEYFDRFYIAWWNGVFPENGKLPHPFVENIEIADDWSSYQKLNFSLRLNNDSKNKSSIVHNIDTKIKKIFKFLDTKIPNVRTVFFINGKKYLCEKITATFSENGMSQLLKGEFFQIVD